MVEVSVITPTYMRKLTLKKVMESLEKQSFPIEKFEMIVVDDGSTDGTIKMLESYQGPLNLVTLSTKLPAGDYGYLRALNIGILNAAGKYLVFLDSDMVVKSDALENLVHAHHKWEKKGEKVLIRAWWARRRNVIKMWFRGDHFSTYTPEKAFKKYPKFRKYCSRNNRLIATDATSAFISIQKIFAVAVDGFPEHAKCYGMDGEFQERLINKLGVRIVFEPEIYAIHGPIRGDIRAKKYKWTKKNAAIYREKQRKGLSSGDCNEKKDIAAG